MQWVDDSHRADCRSLDPRYWGRRRDEPLLCGDVGDCAADGAFAVFVLYLANSVDGDHPGPGSRWSICRLHPLDVVLLFQLHLLCLGSAGYTVRRGSARLEEHPASEDASLRLGWRSVGFPWTRGYYCWHQLGRRPVPVGFMADAVAHFRGGGDLRLARGVRGKVGIAPAVWSECISNATDVHDIPWLFLSWLRGEFAFLCRYISATNLLQIFSQLQFFAMYFMTNKYFSTTLSAVTLLAISGLAIAPAAVVGTLLAKEPRCAQWLISGGWLITTGAAGCSILLNPTTPTVGWLFLMLSAGLGHGLLLSSYNIRVQEILQDQGGFFSTKPNIMSLYMQSWGMAAAVPVGGVVFLNFLGKELEKIALDAEIINQANGYILLMKQVQMSDHEREAIKQATGLALRVVWEVIAGVAAVGSISSVFLWRKTQPSKI